MLDLSRPLTLALAVLTLVGMTACSSDTVLREAPPPDPEEEGSGSGSGRPGSGGGGWPGMPELPGGPWGELDPGEMPDVYFVVAYGDVNCCYECDGLWLGPPDEADDPDQDTDGLPHNSEADMAFGCPVNYAIVDLFGQVVDEFSPANQDQGQIYSHIDLVPTGPGRFLATVQGWGDIYYPPEYPNQTTEEQWPPEDGPIDPWGWGPWIAFEIDAVNRTQEMVAWQSPADYQVVIPETGKRIDVGVYGVQAAIDPVDPDWLYLWGARYGCDEPMLPLRATHRYETGVLDRFWTGEDLLGSDLGAFNWYPTGFAASIDEDGVTHVGMGLGDNGCTGAFQPVHLLADVVPDDGAAWVSANTQSWATTPMSWAPWSGGAAVQIESPWDLPTWHVTRPEDSRSGPVPSLEYNVRPGPMLDPAGPTFALVGSDYTNPNQDRIVFVHGDQEVWSIDALTFGLQERQVAILDVVVLPPFGDDAE